jgi:NadR type nicotinamide-nucleotide adenylyltransferase
MIKKIAVIGPESTGKSILSADLAAHYNAVWIPEYAREYVENLHLPYNFDDVCTIAKKQIEQETEAEKYEKPLVFFDTDLIITKIWFEYCYKKVPDFVTNNLKKGIMDYYLLCFPDISWQPDPVRENGDIREELFEKYKQEIEFLNKPYSIIKGKGKKRQQNAIGFIDKFLKINN